MEKGDRIDGADGEEKDRACAMFAMCLERAVRHDDISAGGEGVASTSWVSVSWGNFKGLRRQHDAPPPDQSDAGTTASSTSFDARRAAARTKPDHFGQR